MSTMSPDEINARMQALLTLDGYGGIIRESDTVAYWRMTSEDNLWIDVTFPDSSFWEYKRKGQKIEWKSGLGVPAQIKGMIETLDSDIMNIWGALDWGKNGVEEVKEVIEMKDEIEEVITEHVDDVETVIAEPVIDLDEKMKILDNVDFDAPKKEIRKPASRQNEVKKEPVQKQNGWKKGGYSAKVKEPEYEYDLEDIEECSDAPEPSRISRRVSREPLRRPSRCIKGLTPRLAERGKIKIGIKGKMTTSAKGNEFRPPKKLDYFVVTTMEKNKEDDFKEDPVIMKILRERAGEENEFRCMSIPVRLPYDDPTLNFPTSYAYYEGSACMCRGDGDSALTSEGEVIDCIPETCPHVKKKSCKPNGVLSVILDDAPLVGGVYKFRTVGWNSINNLVSSMEFIRGLTNGFLAGLPLMLTLTPKHTTVPGTKTPTLIYMVNLEYRGSLAEMAKAIKQTMDTRALMQYSIKDFEKLAEEALALPEAPEECKAIVEEFYPEAVKVV